MESRPEPKEAFLFYMAKGLPYFKFDPLEYITGDITLCPMETQGVFINLCCHYWSKECQLSLANAKQRFSKNETCLNHLLDLDIINVENDRIIINFLDEQMGEFIDISTKRAEAGRKGGKSKAIAKQVSSKESREEVKESREEKSKEEDLNIWPSFEDFWNLYDKKTDSRKTCIPKWNKLTQKKKELIMAHVPLYVSSTPDKKFRKNPSTYLNQEGWTHEIINSTQNGKGFTAHAGEYLAKNDPDWKNY